MRNVSEFIHLMMLTWGKRKDKTTATKLDHTTTVLSIYKWDLMMDKIVCQLKKSCSDSFLLSY